MRNSNSKSVTTQGSAPRNDGYFQQQCDNNSVQPPTKMSAQYSPRLGVTLADKSAVAVQNSDSEAETRDDYFQLQCHKDSVKVQPPSESQVGVSLPAR
jgi:hypothetical protein